MGTVSNRDVQRILVDCRPAHRGSSAEAVGDLSDRGPGRSSASSELDLTSLRITEQIRACEPREPAHRVRHHGCQKGSTRSESCDAEEVERFDDHRETLREDSVGQKIRGGAKLAQASDDRGDLVVMRRAVVSAGYGDCRDTRALQSSAAIRHVRLGGGGRRRRGRGLRRAAGRWGPLRAAANARISTEEDHPRQREHAERRACGCAPARLASAMRLHRRAYRPADSGTTA